MKVNYNSYTINAIMESGRRGLDQARLRMSVTGNNINNVNTEGYSRQGVVTEATTVMQSSNTTYEMSLISSTIRRMRDSFHYQQIIEENPSLGRWEEEHHQLELIEKIMNEPNDGAISNAMDTFFNSWEDLSQDLENQASRTLVRDSGDRLAKQFNIVGTQLSQTKESLNKQIQDEVFEINLLINEIADVNKQITKSQMNTSEFSTLLDRRDKAVSDLSKKMDIKITEKENGDMLIFSNGIVVVEGIDRNQIYTRTDSESNSQLFWDREDNEVQINNGKLKALLNTRDETIPQLEEELNNLVKAIVENVNSIHKESYNLEGNKGYNFFDSSGLDIYTMSLDKNIEESVSYISVSRNQGSHGNSDGAILMSALANERLMDNSTQTFKEYYLGTILTLGNLVNEAERLESVETDFVTFLENKKNEVSQVDADEELSNMIIYQQSYGAAAKLLSKANEMMTVLLSIV